MLDNLFNEILKLRKTIQTKAQLIDYIDLFAEVEKPFKISINDLINAIGTYNRHEIDFNELKYFLTFVFGVETEIIDSTEDKEEAFEYVLYIIDEGLHKRDIPIILRMLKNCTLPFEERDMTDEEYLDIVYKFVDFKSENIREEDILKFKHSLMTLVEKGNIDAIFEYGRIMYGDGYSHGFKQDYKIALDCYLKAGENGISQGYTNAGYIYAYDRLNTGKRDFESAYKFFLKATLMDNNINARYKLFDLYSMGFGVEKDSNLATAIIENLYEQLAPEKCINLSHYHPLFPEVTLRYFANSCQNKLPLDEIDYKNMIMAYFVKKYEIEKHDFVGNDIVLNNIKEIISETMKRKLSRLYNNVFKKEKLVPGELYILKKHDDVSSNIVRYLGSSTRNGEPIEALVDHNFRFEFLMCPVHFYEALLQSDCDDKVSINFTNKDLYEIKPFTFSDYGSEIEGFTKVSDLSEYETLKFDLKDLVPTNFEINRLENGRILSINVILSDDDEDRYELLLTGVYDELFDENDMPNEIDLFINENGELCLNLFSLYEKKVICKFRAIYYKDIYEPSC